MPVHPPNRLVTAAAVAAPAADVVGRLLAPSLLATWPVAIVALSPSDPHVLLASGPSRVVLVLVAFTARLARAWAIFQTTEHLADRAGHAGLRRLLVPRGESRWSRRGGIGAVLVLPGMVGAVVAARARLRPRLYLGLAGFSTAAGLALTLTAARVFERQLVGGSAAIADHPLEATIVVGAIVVFGIVARWRGAVRSEPGSPPGLMPERRQRGADPTPP